MELDESTHPLIVGFFRPVTVSLDAHDSMHAVQQSFGHASVPQSNRGTASITANPDVIRKALEKPEEIGVLGCALKSKRRKIVGCRIEESESSA